MTKITLEIPDNLAQFFETTDKAFIEAEFTKLLRKEKSLSEAGGAEELVRVITRSKARVCNWEDLEREIIKGSIS